MMIFYTIQFFNQLCFCGHFICSWFKCTGSFLISVHPPTSFFCQCQHSTLWFYSSQSQKINSFSVKKQFLILGAKGWPIRWIIYEDKTLITPLSLLYQKVKKLNHFIISLTFSLIIVPNHNLENPLSHLMSISFVKKSHWTSWNLS